MLPILLDLSDEETPAVREGAGFWVRALARGIDTFVHLAVGLAAGLAAGILVAIGGALQGVPTDEALAKLSASTPLGLLAALIGGTAMHALAEGIHGSTVGKRICGLTVISEDGAPATLLGALKRSIAYFCDALFFGLVAAQKMSESPRRQRVGDVWGHTQVVRLSSLDAGTRRSWVRFAVAATAGITVDGVILLTELASRLA
jgi:uncharacterized RDD family membrane protein YckC